MPTGFLRLPPEIHDNIYEHFLVAPEPIDYRPLSLKRTPATISQCHLVTNTRYTIVNIPTAYKCRYPGCTITFPRRAHIRSHEGTHNWLPCPRCQFCTEILIDQHAHFEFHFREHHTQFSPGAAEFGSSLPSTFSNRKSRLELSKFLTIGLLRVNKTIYLRASAIFFGRNTFQLPSSSKEIAAFLANIGRTTPLISDIMISGLAQPWKGALCLGFPSFEGLCEGKTKLRKEGIDILAVVRQCACLSTITLLHEREKLLSALQCLDILKNFSTVRSALAMVNTQLRAVSSLKTIVVEIDVRSSARIQDEMKVLGWTVRLINLNLVEDDEKHEEESDEESGESRCRILRFDDGEESENDLFA